MEFIKICNSKGMSALISPLGASISSLFVPDRLEKLRDIVLGFDSPQMYGKNDKYFGAAIGRYANLISSGTFILSGRKIELSRNYGDHHLHGGFEGFSSVIWDIAQENKNSVILENIFPDGKDGYPGNLKVSLEYLINEKNGIEIKWNAVSDADTIASFTNHSYFNLLGHDSQTLKDHTVQIKSDYFLPIKSDFTPIGEIRSVSGGPMDFREPKEILKDIFSKDEQMALGSGYDHNYVLSADFNEASASVVCKESGIKMSIFTTQPGMQFYSDNDPAEIKGKGGAVYRGRGAI
jgi:aldose 1-epimerase